jgi:hypothetical protein
MGPRTVVWLMEAQHYLLTPPRGSASKVAVGPRDLLRNSGAGRRRCLCGRVESGRRVSELGS